MRSLVRIGSGALASACRLWCDRSLNAASLNTAALPFGVPLMMRFRVARANRRFLHETYIIESEQPSWQMHCQPLQLAAASRHPGLIM